MRCLEPDSATAAEVVKTFRETDETFANPGQGWMTMRRLPDGPGRFPYSVAYFRLNWEELEPIEGQYNWRLIDEAIAAWVKREARIAFRIMTTNAHSRGYYCSPKWLFDAGRDLVGRINQRLGYRLQLVEASWSRTSRAGGSFAMQSTWRNAGAAPCLPAGRPWVRSYSHVGTGNVTIRSPCFYTLA